MPIVLLALKAKCLEASCCRVDVIKGGTGFLFFSFFSTFETTYFAVSNFFTTDFAVFSLDIKKSASLTYRYLERFFEWVYYKTDKLDPVFEELNLRKVIGLAVSRSLREQTYLGEINFNVDSDLRILADNESIVKVLYYIVENSIKYNNDDIIKCCL